MNILLVNVPSRTGQGTGQIPYGLLYAAGVIERSGHKAKIFDPYLDADRRDMCSGGLDGIIRIIKEFEPAIIGFTGIASSYGRTKIISNDLRKKFPKIFQIAGGPLASVYELLLTKTGIDVVFHGEAEVNLPEFLQRFSDGENVYDVPGISYSKGAGVIRKKPAEQVKDLDTIPFPPYHLVNVEKYQHDINGWFESYRILLSKNGLERKLRERIGTGGNFFHIFMSRGCTHSCLFCYRHFRGMRQNSVEYVIKHIKHLNNTYGIRGFAFYDELFNADEDWVFSFCDALDREKLDIYYFVGGARVDKVSERMVERLRDTGCIELGFGQESGSDTILKEYRKGATVKQNQEATNLTRRMGVSSPVQIVIGSPSETDRTVAETIQFLKSVDAYPYSSNYFMPLPETPVWPMVEKKGLIPDVEKYLDQVAEYGGSEPLVNLTDEPYRKVRRWGYLIKRELLFDHLKKNGFTVTGYLQFLGFVLKGEIRLLLPKWVAGKIKRIIN